MNNKEAVTQLLENARGLLNAELQIKDPSEELVLLAAKEMNLVVGKRGRDGGTFATDAGLRSINVDIAQFRVDEVVAKELARAQRVKTSTVVEETTVTEV